MLKAACCLFNWLVNIQASIQMRSSGPTEKYHQWATFWRHSGDILETLIEALTTIRGRIKRWNVDS